MDRKTGFAVWIIAGFFVASGISLGLAEEQDPVLAEETAPLPEPAENDSQAQWLWGEIASIDAQNKTITVKYLDYETDQDKEITVSIDEKTSYENINSLEDLKPLDAVSIDYIVSAAGKNIAQNIGVEKPEAVEEAAEGGSDQPGLEPEAISPAQERAATP